MGKASRKKQSSSPAGKPTSEQAGKPAGEETAGLSGRQTDGQTGWSGGKLASRQIIYIFTIVVLGFLVYSNTFKSPFQWDESDFIVGNPIVRNLDYFKDPSLAKGFPVYDALKSRYIGYLTFALNYRFHEFNVFGYHVVNLAIHLISAILAYFLVLLTFRTPFMRGHGSGVRGQQSGDSRFTVHNSRLFALAVALLFVAHPIQIEAVTYVFQRLASLVSMFYLLSLALYIKVRLSTGSNQQSAEDSSYKAHSSRFTIIWYLLSLLAAVLAMKTKENAFTLPVIITLYEFLFFSGPLKSRVLRLLPFLMTMLIIPVTIMGTNSTAGEIISQIKDPAALGYDKISGSDYFLTQFRVIITYIRLLFFPAHQNIDYDYPVFNTLFTPPVFLSFLLLASLFGAAVYLIYRSRQTDRLEEGSAIDDSRFASNYSRLIGFGILWFFITLSVESSIIPIPMLINEYRVYLPSVGFFIALIAGVLLLIKQNPHFTKIAAILFAVVILGLASATYARNALWKDKVSLWEDTVSKSPNSSRGYNNLGIAYNENRQYEKAINMYEKALAMRPLFLDAQVNLGVTYASTGQVNKAIEQFTQALAIHPKHNVVYMNLARVYIQAGRPDMAVENYLRAIELNPFNSSAYHGVGTAYMRLGKVDEAIAAYSQFAAVSPSDPEAYRNRGLAYATKGDFNSARADFQQACSRGSAESCNYLQNPQFR